MVCRELLCKRNGMTKHTIKGSGGKREGAGGKKPLKYGEQTVNVTFRVPISKKEAFRKYGNAKLKTYIKNPKGE